MVRNVLFCKQRQRELHSPGKKFKRAAKLAVTTAKWDKRDAQSGDSENLALPDTGKIYAGLEYLGVTTRPIQGPSGWIYAGYSCGCLRTGHPLRALAIRTVELPLFSRAILFTILCNCVTMAWTSPLDLPGTPKAEFLDRMEWVYLIIFTFELLIKMLAYGIYSHKHSYLRDPWCKLDFVVVGLAWLPYLLPHADLKVLDVSRAARAFRPLRALRRVPGMPVLVGSIFKSIPKLGHVLSITAFIFLLFGILGFNLFRGVLHARCADPSLTDP